MLTSRRDEIVWTGDRWLDYLLNLGGFTREDLEATVSAARGALQASRPDGAPDHHLRLRGAELVSIWLGLRGGRERDASEERPTVVNLVFVDGASRAGSDGRAEPGPETHGVRVRIGSGNGGSA